MMVTMDDMISEEEMQIMFKAMEDGTFMGQDDTTPDDDTNPDDDDTTPVDPVVEQCNSIYQQTMEESGNAGNENLQFADFYEITCGNFWPYCS